MTDPHPADRHRGLPRRHLGRTVTGALTAALALVTPALAGAAEAPAAAPVAPVAPGAAAPAAAAADVPLSACADPDHGLPVITDVAVTPRVIDVRRHRAPVRVVAHVTDTGGPGPARGVSSADVTFGDLKLERATPPGEPPGGNRLRLAPQPDGSWAGSGTVMPDTVPAGVDRLTGATISDGLNLRFYGSDSVPGAGTATVRVLAHQDTTRPTFRRLTLQRRRLDAVHGPRTARVTLRVRDTGTGVTSVAVRALAGGVATLHPAGHHRPITRTRGVTGSSLWTGRLIADRYGFTASRRAALAVEVTDGAGHVGFADAERLARRGMPSQVRVRRTADHTGPALTVLDPNPTVDLRATDQVLLVRVRATDRVSGVAAIYRGIETTDPNDRIGVRLTGTRRDGVWLLRLPLLRCFTVAGDTQLEVTAIDRSGVQRGAAIAVHILNSDVTAPTAAVSPQSTRPTGAITVTFAEDVTGVTPAAVPVERVDTVAAADGTGVRDVLGPPLPGHLSCVAAGGTIVDCATGAMRVITWAPDPPLTPGTYQLEINPEHVLSVRDLAGNRATGGGRFTVTG